MRKTNLEQGAVYYIGGSDTLPPPLSKEEENLQISALKTEREKAISVLIEHNLRLVVYIAKRFENTKINIEDLISTGGSSLKAVDAIRRDGCEVIGMVASYTYGFPVAIEAFKEAKVNLITLTNYEAVLDVALRTEYINEEDVPVLNAWRQDPAHWDVKKQ